MSRTSPSVRYFPATAGTTTSVTTSKAALLDASKSRTYLTTRNYRGGSLLRTVGGITISSNDTSPTSRTRLLNGSDGQPQREEMANLDEEDIMKAPESSDDDDDEQEESRTSPESSDTATNGRLSHMKETMNNGDGQGKRKRQDKHSEDSASKKKRVKTSAQSKRISKRRQTSPENESMQEMNEDENQQLPKKEGAGTASQPTTSQQDFVDIFSQTSQSSQNKRRRADYSRTNMVDPAADRKREESEKKKAQQDARTMSVPPELSPDRRISTPKKLKGKNIIQVEDYVSASPSRNSGRKRQPVKQRLEAVDPLSPDEGDKKAATNLTSSFSMPNDDLLPVSSTNSLETEATAISDVEEVKSTRSGKRVSKRHRSRSPSSSSGLSDLDSVVSVELSPSQKDDIRNGVDTLSSLPRNHVRCPVCSAAVNVLNIRTKNNKDPSKLSLSHQQDYHHRHQVHDASQLWQSQKYPEINWTKLKTDRIKKHLPTIRQILYRKRPSHFLTLLEEAISHTRGNKTKLKKYLTEDLVDTVKMGYYGPRGAKIMAQVLAEELNKPLRHQMKADQTITTTGTSGFISAVLLPEVCVQLVMEDMHLLDSPSSTSTSNSSDDNNAQTKNRDKTDKKEKENQANPKHNQVGRTAQEKALAIMQESSWAGILLCPDDDHVVRKED